MTQPLGVFTVSVYRKQKRIAQYYGIVATDLWNAYTTCLAYLPPHDKYVVARERDANEDERTEFMMKESNK